jgi:hypothetical protein
LFFVFEKILGNLQGKEKQRRSWAEARELLSRWTIHRLRQMGRTSLLDWPVTRVNNKKNQQEDTAA